jgi:hypothetical protein
MRFLCKMNMSFAAVLLSMPALAQGHHHGGGRGHGHGVPEIDTGAGLLSLAAITTVGVIAYMRRRR